jgi:hypothetical protein
MFSIAEMFGNDPERLPWQDLSGLGGTAHEPLIHARKRFGVPALCGAMTGMWAHRRCAVTCPACKVEIERRLAKRLPR